MDGLYLMHNGPKYKCPGKKMNLNINSDNGFTLLETIVVLIILGIISAVIISRFMVRNIDLIGQTEVIKTHLRFAQTRAMNSDTVWYLQFTGNTYSLYKSGDLDSKYMPGEDNAIVTLPSGISVNCEISNIISFDSWGKPCSDDAGQTLQATDRSITVSAGLKNEIIIITKNTGFIE